jgi:predicted dehydrogenase
MSSPMRFAMIGAGGVANSHLDAFTRRPDRARLVAACDVNAAAAAAFAQRAPNARDVAVHTDYKAVLRDRSKFDAAVVTLPHYLHFPVAREFVEAGIPVLVEKPLVVTLDEMRRLRDLAAARRVPVMAGQTRRFDRNAIWVRRWVDGDPRHFGPLRSFDLTGWQNVYSYTGGPRNAGHWIFDGKRAGGGVVQAVGVHRIDLVRFVAGTDFAEVTARGRFDPPFHDGAESSATVLMTTIGGATGVMHLSYLAPRCPYGEAMTLFGEHGTVLEHAASHGDYLGAYRVATASGRETTTWAHQYEDFRPVPERDVTGLDADPFVNQLVAFCDAVWSGAAPPSDVRENFNTIATIQAIYDSFRSGKSEKVATS